MRRPTPIAARIDTRRTRRNEIADDILFRVSELKSDAVAR